MVPLTESLSDHRVIESWRKHYNHVRPHSRLGGISLTKRFDNGWREDLAMLLAIDERGQELNALVGVRNQIAHGKNQGIDMQRVKEHRKVVDMVVDHLLEQFAPVS